MLKKLIISALLGVFILATQNICGSPADPNPAKIKQPDGTEITIKLKGDENVKWMESLDGYSLLYSKDKYIVYAVQNEKGDMVPSEVVFRDAALRSTDLSDIKGTLKKGLRYSSSQIRIFREIDQIEQQAQTAASLPKLRATTGQAKAICALVGFPDKPFSHTVAEFEQLMNQVGYSANGARGSVYDFYKENSYGKLSLIVTVVGPYTAAKNWRYYGENESSSQKDKNVKELAREAANFAFTDPSVNLADYDNDGDGTIDTFHFLYAGFGEEIAGSDPDCIWAHKSGYSPALTFGSKRLSIYSCSPELRGNSGNSITNIGVICHELCHVFGAPDYYDTNDQQGGDFAGTGQWDLMAQGSWNNNGISPAHINMYQKIVFGWVTPTELSKETRISGMLNSAKNSVAYKVNTTTPGEYFILENRQKTGFDSYLPGSGLLIYRVSSLASGNSVNNTTHPQQVYPVCASSLISIPNSDPASYGGINSDGCPFPGTSGNTSFTDYSIPSSRSWNGNNTSKPITEIKNENQLISFSFMKSGSTVSNVKTSVNGSTVVISWNPPQGAAPDKYAIYRNNQTLVILNNGSAKSYTQYGVSAGTYTYCVAPIYGVSESTKQCASTTLVSGSVKDCPPVNNLTVVEKANKMSLSWGSNYQDIWISQAGSFTGNFVGYDAKNYTVATRFTVNDLSYVYGLTLTKVNIAIYDLTCKYAIKIWTPNANGTPSTTVLSQSFTPTKTGQQEITLTNPVNLTDTGKELWIGISFEQSTIGSVAAVDGGPQKTSVNYISMNNTWYRASSSDDFNFYIRGYLENKNVNVNTGSSSLAEINSDAIQQIPAFGEQVVLKSSLPVEDENTLRASSGTFSGYKIYRDNQYLRTVATKSFTDENVPLGEHVYCVSTVYGDCESEQMCVVANSTQPLNQYAPVNQLATSVSLKKVSLSWTKPKEKGGSIEYSSGTSFNLISSTSPLDFDMAIRFAKGDLTSQHGSKLTKVKFIPASMSNTYSIRVWQGGNATTPGTLLVDQPVTANRERTWQEVSLKTPVNLDIYEELWIGVHCVAPASQYSMVCDNTAAVPGKGNLIYIDNQWRLAGEVSDKLTHNWFITGVLEFPYTLSGYRIYRNNQVVGNTSSTTFTETLANNGTFTYGVSALYGGNESDKSETKVVIGSTGIDKILYDNLVNVFPNPIARGELLTIDLGTENTSAEVSFCNISGQVVKKESLRARVSQCSVNLPSGTYLVQVYLKSGQVKTAKILVK